MRKIKLLGIRRSGNHAVLGWIADRNRGKVCFLNSVAVKGNQKRNEKLNTLPSKNICKDMGKSSLLLCSYEELSLSAFQEHSIFPGLLKGPETQALVLRDPFNTFASRLKGIRTLKATQRGFLIEDPDLCFPPHVSILWKQYAKEYLGITKKLGGAFVGVNYNSWFTNPDYRCELANVLGLKPSAEPFERVPGFGFGSSFDRKTKDGEAYKMNVLTRWEEFADDPTYHKYFDDELLELSKEIFPHIEGPFSR
jgi:hypothetical protein